MRQPFQGGVLIDEPDALFVGRCLCADAQVATWRVEKSVFCNGGRVLALHIDQASVDNFAWVVAMQRSISMRRGESS